MTALAHHSAGGWADLSRSEVDELQLEALRYRFAELRNEIPAITRLADDHGIHRLQTLDDIGALLLDRAVYASYPPSLLADRNFGALNWWLARFVTHDVAQSILAVDVSACAGLHEWLTAMHAQVPGLRLCPTLTPMGTYSLLPKGDRELAMHTECGRGHVHFSHTAIPFVVDPKTHALLPRHGRTTGHAGFFDLSAEIRWGGMISDREIAIEWVDPCPCGRIGPHAIRVDGGVRPSRWPEPCRST